MATERFRQRAMIRNRAHANKKLPCPSGVLCGRIPKDCTRAMSQVCQANQQRAHPLSRKAL